MQIIIGKVMTEWRRMYAGDPKGDFKCSPTGFNADQGIHIDSCHKNLDANAPLERLNSYCKMNC
jgi:hypothetical protein